MDNNVSPTGFETQQHFLLKIVIFINSLGYCYIFTSLYDSTSLRNLIYFYQKKYECDTNDHNNEVEAKMFDCKMNSNKFLHQKDFGFNNVFENPRRLHMIQEFVFPF